MFVFLQFSTFLFSSYHYLFFLLLFMGPTVVVGAFIVVGAFVYCVGSPMVVDTSFVVMGNHKRHSIYRKNSFRIMDLLFSNT